MKQAEELNSRQYENKYQKACVVRNSVLSEKLNLWSFFVKMLNKVNKEHFPYLFFPQVENQKEKLHLFPF